MAGTALGRSHDVGARFRSNIRIDPMAGTAGRRVRHVGMVAHWRPGRGAMAQVAGIIRRYVAGYFTRGGDAMAALAGAGLNARMVKAGRQPGSGAVASVAGIIGCNVVARFARGGATIVASFAGAGSDIRMREAGTGPGSGRRMTGLARQHSGYMVGRLARCGGAATGAVADGARFRCSLEDALHMTVFAL